jgi:hypothetical protein
MRSRTLPWLVALPSVALGLVAAHLVGSHLAVAHVREVVETAGEQSSTHAASATVVAAFLGVMVLAGSAVLAGCLRNRVGVGKPAPMLFLILPVIAWPVQEFLERIAHPEGGLGVHALLDPSLLRGILLQIPFAIAAYFLARFLLKVVSKIVAALATRRSRAHRESTAIRRPATSARPVRTRITALRHAQRAPPLPALL